MIKKVFGIIVIVYLIMGSPRIAAEVASPEAEKELTRGDVILLLSATDFMKRKIGELLSWSVGFDITKINRARLVPTINWIKAVPKKVPPDGRTVLMLETSVDDPAGLANISGVRADMSSIGKLPNMALVDNGLFGDLKANDGIYTLQTNVKENIPLGTKEIPVAVANKRGWLTLSKTALDVEKNPTILEVMVSRAVVEADSKTPVTLGVRIDNPGRIEDLKSVIIDLRSIGGTSNTPMVRTEGNLFTVQTVVKSGTGAGDKKLAVEVENLIGGRTEGEIILKVK